MVQYAADSSANARHGQYGASGPVTAAHAGEIESGDKWAYFDGVDDAIYLYPSDQAPSDSFTVGMFFKRDRYDSLLTDSGIAERLFTQYDNTGVSRVAVGIDANKIKLLLRTDDGLGAVTEVFDHPLLIQQGDLHFLALTVNEQDVVVSLDDRILIRVTGRGTAATKALTPAGVFRMQLGSDLTGRFYQGYLDEVFIDGNFNPRYLQHHYWIGTQQDPAFTFYGNFDPDTSGSGVSINSTGRIVTGVTADFQSAKMSIPMRVGTVASVEYKVFAKDSNMYLTLAPSSFSVEGEDLPPQLRTTPSISMRLSDGEIYINTGAVYSVLALGASLVVGDVIRFDYDEANKQLDVYQNNILRHNNLLYPGTGTVYHYVCCETGGIVELNAGTNYFQRPTDDLSPLKAVTFTPSESEIMYQEWTEARCIFRDVDKGGNIVDPRDGAVIGSYSGAYSHLSQSLTPDPNDLSFRVEGGTAALTALTHGVSDDLFLHINLYADYEDLFETRRIFYCEPVVGYTGFDLSLYSDGVSSGGHIRLTDDGVVKFTTTLSVVMGSVPIGLALNDAGSWVLYVNGVQVASAAAEDPTRVKEADLYLGSNNLGAEHLDGRFSHVFMAEDKNIRKWRYTRLANFLGGSDLEDVNDPGYALPLEGISQRLYDLVNVDYPDQAPLEGPWFPAY